MSLTHKLVTLSLRISAVVLGLSVAIVGLGGLAYSQLDIEAYPNPVPPMIEIITQPAGWSAEEVERYVTIPLENALTGMVHLDHIRSQSLFGLSDVKCYFTWDVDYYGAQQRVLNRLSFAELPDGLKPELSPTNAIGEIYRYVLRGKGYTLTDLKTAEDWVLEREFRRVPGVIDVVSFGGYTKEYHVEVDPVQLKGHDVSLQQLMSAVQNANQNVGGQRMAIGEQSFNIRGIGLIRSLRDIGEVVVAQKKGVPVRVRDLAAVLVGHAPRLGVVGKDQDSDVVQGVVLMRYGGDSQQTIKGVHERIAYIRKNHILPPGMDIEEVYDRGELVKVTTHTVVENLLVGMLLVFGVLWLFLGTARAALIAAINIPLSLLLAFIGIVGTHTPANLISLGAVDFGIVVDSTVIMVENIFRHLGVAGRGTLRQRIAAAGAEVGPPILFSTLIIAVAFLPLFTLSGVAGVIFAPMAQTYAFAIGGALLLAFTLTPVLAKRFLRGALHKPAAQASAQPPAPAEEHESWAMARLSRLYRPLFELALRRKKLSVLLVSAIVVAALGSFPLLGKEFMPKLEEGNFWIRAMLPTSISIEQSSRYVRRMRAILLGCPDGSEERTEPTGDADKDAAIPLNCPEEVRTVPEIRAVISQVGRPDDGTDTAGFNNIELLAPLRPRSEWRKGVTKESLTADLSKKLEETFPGVVFNFSQVISDNVEEAMSGVKGENTVKVVGPDLHVNEDKAGEIVALMDKIPGVTDLGMFHVLGQPNVRITPDRVRCGLHGLNVGDVQAVVQAAIGGQTLTQVYEGQKHFDLTVRWAELYRKDLRAIRNILVPTPDGGSIPLGQIANIVMEEGPAVIYREDNQRYTPVKFSVRGRDLGSTIEDAQRQIRQHVTLPYDTHLEWAGEIDQLRDTISRLTVILPITLLLIAFLVYSLVKSWTDTLIVLAGIPTACTGGVLALLLTGTNFSISAAMGFISIFGVAIQDALIVVTYAQRLWREGYSIEEGARQAAARGLRPVLMTTFVAMIGLLPAALSRGIGSETQKPLATVVIGGALALALLPRLLQPALLALCHKAPPVTRDPDDDDDDEAEGEAHA